MPLEEGKFWFDFDTHTFMDRPINYNYPDPPEKMTQEEWKFMKIIATNVKDWWSIRSTASEVTRLNERSLRDMEKVYETIEVARQVANLFGDRKRVKVICDYAKKNYRAALYYAAEQKV